MPRQLKNQRGVRAHDILAPRRPPRAETEPWDNVTVAVVATMGTVDRDRQLILPGALVNTDAYVSAWNHSAKYGAESPVGEAYLWEENGRLYAQVTYEDTPAGRTSSKRVASELPDWSVYFETVESRPPTREERERGALKTIVKWNVYEVSPVDEGTVLGCGTYVACHGKKACREWRMSPAATKPLKPLMDAPPDLWIPEDILLRPESGKYVTGVDPERVVHSRIRQENKVVKALMADFHLTPDRLGKARIQELIEDEQRRMDEEALALTNLTWRR
jgi:hypothetical protein